MDGPTRWGLTPPQRAKERARGGTARERGGLLGQVLVNGCRGVEAAGAPELSERLHEEIGVPVDANDEPVQ